MKNLYPTKVSFQVSPRERAEELARNLSEVAKDVTACTPIPSRRFSGQDLEMLVLALGSAGFVTTAAKVIVEWIRGNRGFTKIGPVVMHNPSPAEVEIALLEAAKIIRSEKQTKSSGPKASKRKAAKNAVTSRKKPVKAAKKRKPRKA